MKRVLGGLLAWAALAAPVWAAGYDDFALGVTARNRGELDAAIAAFSSALKAPDLIAAYLPAAYRGRAIAYLARGKCSEAAADLDAATALVPLNPTGYTLRAYIKLCLRDIAGAQQDFETAMGPEPDASLYFNFGRQLWGLGMFEDAHTNLLHAAELLDTHNRAPHAGYIVLWYAITADRLGKLDKVKLEESAGKLDSSDWPMPLVKVFLGKYDPDKARSKIVRASSEDYAGQKCETDFYVGEWQIARGNSDAAKPLIASAQTSCPKSFIEYPAAQDEAKRLGLAPVKE